MPSGLARLLPRRLANSPGVCFLEADWATRLAARRRDSNVPASVHQPSRYENVMRAFSDIGVVDVGDFELAAPGRLQGLDLVEDRRVVHVDAGHGVVAISGWPAFLRCRRCGRRRDFGDAEALGVRDFFEQDLRAGGLRRESVAPPAGYCASMMLSPRTTQILLAVGEVLGEAERLGDAAFAFLVGVIEVLSPNCLPLPSSRRKSPEFVRR